MFLRSYRQRNLAAASVFVFSVIGSAALQQSPLKASYASAPALRTKVADAVAARHSDAVISVSRRKPRQQPTTPPLYTSEPYGGDNDFPSAAAAEDMLGRRNFLLFAPVLITAVAVTGARPATAASDSAAVTGEPVDYAAILERAKRKALGGGKAGAAAAVVQVFSLMWLRTAMNYQYRYGGTLPEALSTLSAEGAGDSSGFAASFGGVRRLYTGLPFALVQGPLTRFGDTAANVGTLAILNTAASTADLPLFVKIAVGSAAAGLWRIALMPIDSAKTAMQVEGQEGLAALRDDVFSAGSPAPLFRGALAAAAATAAGHYPWFLTYNTLDGALPPSPSGDALIGLVRAASLGLGASCVSDCVSNSLRVVKTTRQTATLGRKDGGDVAEIGYVDTVKMIIEDDGLVGLFGRGLQTRLLTNAIQGAAFSVLWKYFQTKFA